MTTLTRWGNGLRYRVRALGRRLTLPVYDSLPEGIQKALTILSFEVKAARIARKSRRLFSNWRDQQDLKLNLGCGGDLKAGWINVDLWIDSVNPEPASADGTFINYDLRRGIPLNDGSCAIVYSSHFFEHLEYEIAMRLLRECHRVLKPGGTFRISLPDFKSACRAYLNNDAGYFELVDTGAFLPEVEPGTLTLIDYLNFAAYQSGEHKRVYDEEKIVALLKQMGFTSVQVCSYESAIDPPSPLRIDYSFYVQATR